MFFVCMSDDQAVWLLMRVCLVGRVGCELWRGWVRAGVEGGWGW